MSAKAPEPAGPSDPKPMLSSGGRGRSRHGGRRIDAVTLLTVYLVLLLGLPSTLKIAALRGVGSPATLFGVVMAGVWIYWQVQRVAPTRAGSQPVRFAFLAAVSCFALSFVAATVRPIDQAETSASILGAIGLISWGGSLLLANDGISSHERYLVFLRRLVLAGACLSVVGLVQFVTGQRFVDLISIPGFNNAQTEAVISTRSGFNRPAGTALHAIEFGYVITMILPLAMNLAVVDRARSGLRRGTPVVLLLLTVVTSISRSALICGFLAIVVAAQAWSPSLRRRALLASPILGVAVFVTIPGLLGSVLGLFTGIADDSSALSRTSSYAIAFDFVLRSPLIGRGFGTFTPDYRILDNAYLLLLIEVGAVGLIAVLALIITGMWCARRVRVVASSVEDRSIAQALIGSLVSGAVGLAFFDGLSFPMASGTLFLVLGLAGCQWRLTRRSLRTGPPQKPVA